VKPLQAVAMGYVFIALYARFDGYDAYADPVGWALVLYGVHRLPAELPSRGGVLYLGWIAGLVSVPLWFPAVIDRLEDADESLAWAIDLPQFGFGALLCISLARAATADGDARAARWLRMLATAIAVVAVLPVLVFGGGLDDLADPAGLAVQVVYVGLVWMMFQYSGRLWAGAPVVEEETASGTDGRPRGDRPS
jgi:hypothetical protein